MEFVSLGDVVRFGITIHNPANSGSLVNADETPRFYAYRNNIDTAAMTGDFVLRTGLIGTYRASGIFNAGAGFSISDYVEIHASGKVNGAVSREIIKTFVINDVYDANLVLIEGSGIVNYTIVDANVVQVSGEPVSLATTVDANVVSVSGIPVAPADDLYFANIKFVKDIAGPRDEYVVNWFKNAIPLPSGQVTNAALSVHRTSDNNSLFTNQPIAYFSTLHGGLRHNETVNIAVSGEPYLAVASGTISGSTRVWQNIVGIDYL